MPTTAPEDNYSCRIVRSDRPCLVCPGRMDLVQAHPRYSLFSGLPLCSSETLDCLDCPKCGFSTSTTDYEYLQICKRQRSGMFYASGRSGGDRKRSSGRSSFRRENGRIGSDSGRLCATCNASLSREWRFCPGCGNKCGANTPTSSISFSPVVTHSTDTLSKATAANSPSDTSMDCGDHSCAGDSQDSGIMRMVTPPKRHTGKSDASQVSL